MISEDEMELAIRQIVDYCNAYEGENGDVILGLLEELNEYASLRARDQASRSTRETFFNALSTLLLIADPPGRLQFGSTLASLSELTGSPITTAAFDPDPLAWDEAAKDLRPIEADLPSRREFKADERATISYFRNLLSDESPHRTDQGDAF